MRIPAIVRKLNRRERYVVYGASVVVTLMMLHWLIVSPLTDSRRRMARSLAAKTRISGEMMALASEYNRIKAIAAASATIPGGRRTDFTLFSFLDQQVGGSRMKEHITYMKPSTATPKNSPYRIAQVEMKFQSITIEQLTTYLHKVETSKNRVSVKRLSISKDTKQSGLINAVLQVEAPEI